MPRPSAGDWGDNRAMQKRNRVKTSRQKILSKLAEFGVGDRGESKLLLHKRLWRLRDERLADELQKMRAMGYHVHHVFLPYAKNEVRFVGYVNRVVKRRFLSRNNGR